MNCRPSLIFCLLLALLGLGLADVSGPDPAGQPARHAPVLIAGKVSPSPQTSPGVVQNIGVDSLGAVLANITTAGLANLLTADQDSGGGTQTGAIVGIAVPASGGAVQVPGSATTGLRVSISDGSGGQLGSSTGLEMQGNVGHDSPVIGYPVLVGGYAHVTGDLPASVATGDAARILTDPKGRLRVSLESSGNGAVLSNDNGNYIQGPVAHDAAVAGNPARIGARARSINAPLSAVSADDVSDLTSTTTGLLRVVIDSSTHTTGSDVFRTVALTNVSQEVKNSFGNTYGIVLGNPNTNNAWVHLYNTANASVTVGTTTPLCSYMVAANATLVVPGPVTYNSAIAIACTNASSGTQAPANNLTATVHYK